MPTDNIQLEQAATLELEKQSLIQAAEFVGATRLINRLSGDLALQTMQALEVFQTNKMYEQYGFKSFADFLDKCPSSPMTKNQYYDRKKLLDQEGEEAFNLLNSLNVAAKHRKLLTAGDIVLDGDQLIVGNKAVAINDAKAVRKAIAQAVQRFETIEAKSAKAEKEIEKLKKQVEELKAEAENTTPPPPDLTDECAQTLITLISAFARLKNLLAEEKNFRTETWIHTYRRRIDLAVEDFATFCNSYVGDDDELTDEELAQIMED